MNHPYTIFREGMYPIHYAAAGGSIVVVRWLMEHMGAKADALDRERQEAVTVAAKRGHLEVVRYLVQTARASVFAVTDVTLLQDLLKHDNDTSTTSYKHTTVQPIKTYRVLS